MNILYLSWSIGQTPRSLLKKCPPKCPFVPLLACILQVIKILASSISSVFYHVSVFFGNLSLM